MSLRHVAVQRQHQICRERNIWPRLASCNCQLRGACVCVQCSGHTPPTNIMHSNHTPLSIHHTHGCAPAPEFQPSGKMPHIIFSIFPNRQTAFSTLPLYSRKVNEMECSEKERNTQKMAMTMSGNIINVTRQDRVVWNIKSCRSVNYCLSNTREYHARALSPIECSFCFAMDLSHAIVTNNTSVMQNYTLEVHRLKMLLFATWSHLVLSVSPLLLPQMERYFVVVSAADVHDVHVGAPNTKIK